MRSLAARRARDLFAALTTIPDSRTWGACAVVYCVFLACALPIGLLSGLLQPGAPHLRPAAMAGTGVLVFFQPVLVEEVVFRGLLLPREARAIGRGRLAWFAGVALALYVASHPINAALLRPGLLHVFASPAYLAIVALLGLACTAAYWISRSIWPPVVIHWVTVLAWLWLLGGQALLC